MPRQKWQDLSLENLAEINKGVVASAFNAELRKALLDCADRPNEDKARVVKMEIALIPKPGNANDCEAVDVQFRFSSSIPKAATRDYQMPVKERQGSRGETVVTAQFAPELTEDEPEFVDAEGNGREQ